MSGIKLKKGPILLPLVLLAASLTAYTALNFRGATAADSLSVGQQYLNEMDYGGAVAAFTQAIELDPTSREARLGLAQAYQGAGDTDFARDMLEDMVYTQSPDQDATSALLDLLRENGQLVQAVELSQQLIDATDADEYYTLQVELLTGLAAQPRALAVGTDQTLMIQNGRVLSRGSNTLGQLGVDPAAIPGTEQYIDAQFPGSTPRKVACLGRTSYVVDDSGALWTAGENRWGQMGGGYATTVPQGGWVQVPVPGSVADVAGTTGRLLVLLTDGSLWTAGAGAEQELTRMARFPVVIQVASNQQYAAVLTADGQLYRSPSENPNQWELEARDVSSFTLTEEDLSWVTTGNQMSGSRGGYSTPSDWYDENGNMRPAFYLHEIARLDGRTILTDMAGTLYRIQNDGALETVSTPAPVAAIHGAGSALVLELTDGSALMWEQGMDAPQALA